METIMSEKEKIQIEVEVPVKKLHVEHAFCPNGHQLVDDSVKIHDKSAIKVKVKYQGQEGFFYIDPTYGSYDNIEEGISLPKGAVLEFFCPECGVSLTDKDETCQICSAPLFVLELPKNGIVEGCLRKGCVFHKMKLVDAEQQIARLFENDTMESYL